eukprot:2213365-Amphidinium_carterae.1
MWGKRLSPALRHGVLQGSKLRPVDDFTRSGANLTNATFSKPYLQTLDEFVANGRLLHKRLVDGLGTASVRLRGRTLDLDSALKQLPTHPAE